MLLSFINMLARLISLPVESIIKLRSYLFANNYLPNYSSNKYVISVGNISLGGTGKTPFVIFLSNMLTKENLPNLILTRGYKRLSQNTLLIQPDSQLNFSIFDIGDEAFLISKRTKATIVVAKKKYTSLSFINKIPNIKVVIIDDGFQHLRIKRNLDFVLVDVKTIKYPNIFPLGNLREPIDALHRASIIVTYEKDPIGFFLNTRNIKKPMVVITKSINNIFDTNGNLFPISKFKSKDVILVSGLANNYQFYSTIIQTGIFVLEHIKFKDHHWYNEKDILNIILKCKKSNCSQILTNEKDFYKLLLFKEMIETYGIELYSTKLEIEVSEGYEYITEKILEIKVHQSLFTKEK
ncbi:MAG: tetraacyldisaccharide 4'-kinase [Candidatus Kapaibacteriales bacterium]